MLGCHCRFFVHPLTIISSPTRKSIARDLWRGKYARKPSFRIAELFYTAAEVLTVLALIAGVPSRSDPATTFGALFPIVWLLMCLGWCLLNRIAAA